MMISDWTQYKTIYDTVRVNKSYWPAIAAGPYFEWSMGQELRNAAQECPDKVALVDGQPDATKRRRWTYSQLLAEAEQCAYALLDKFKPGERVGIWASNRPEWIIAEYGCALAGLVIVTVNPGFKLSELEYEMRQADAVGLIMADENHGFGMLECAREVQSRVPTLRELIRFADWDKFINSGSKSVPLPDVQAFDPLFQLYTSGTTGEPKGAILHHMGMLNTEFHFGEFSGLGEDGVYVQGLPLFHIATGGLAVISCLTHRATLVILPDANAANFLDCIEKEGGTFLQIPPVVVNQMLALPGAKEKMKTIKAIGSMEYKRPTIDRIHQEVNPNIKIQTCFGQTEAHGLLVMSHADHTTEEMTINERAGKPFPYAELKVADPETGEILPLNEVGEICFRGFQNMLGYYNMPEQTEATLKADKWQHTGDLGSMDEEGWISVKGRLKDMVRRGSQNIYPREIEKILLEHPKVQNVIVLGMPHDELGEEVAAAVTPHSGDDMPTAQELFDFCKDRLTFYKCPRLWCITTSTLPYTLSGKAQKFVLRDVFLKGELDLERVG